MQKLKSVHQEGVTESTPQTQEEFENYLLNSINLVVFEGVRKFKSVQRAIRRGHVTRYGIIIPRRPFNNRKPTRGRRFNEEKKRIFNSLKDYERRHGYPYSEGL